MPPPDHPTPDVLAAFVHGRLSDDDSTAIERHLTDCAACRQVVEQVPPDSFLRQVREAAPPPRGGTVIAAASPSLAVALEELPPELADHDRYQVVRKLKEGGMGAVYLARHRLMNRSAVLKLIRPRYLARDDIRQRFEREVNAVSQLSHANIVQAYDAFHAGDSMVLAMECVDGIDLAAFVEAKGPLEVPLACRCVLQAALGLQYAHEQGLVHRDIKPHNLMITRKGQIKVLDFGLALLTQPGAGSGSGLTQDGMLMGTPEYLAPEQWGLPHGVDIRADLYALGCTLFFLLTGRPPFPGPGTLALLRQHADEPAPSLRAARPEVPEGLEVVYQKLMAKAPADRYATPKELARALAPFVKGVTAAPALPPLPPLAHPSTPTRVGGGSETSPPVPRVTPPIRSAPRRRQSPVWLVATASGVILTLAALAVFVLTIRTADGVIELEDLPADAEVRIDGKQADVRYRDGSKAEVRVTPGTRQVQVRKSGFQAIGKEVTLTTGGRVVLTARLKPVPRPVPPPAPPGPVVAPTPPPAPVVTPTPPPAVAGFVSLFNGKDLTGWQGEPGKTNRWMVAHGVLTCWGESSHLFSRRDDYADFHLRVEARLNARGNSGVYVRASPGSDRPHPTGYEAQIWHGPAKSRAGITGSLWGLANYTQPLTAPNEWFTLEVIAEGARIRVRVNGFETVDYTDPQARHARGQFALQHLDENTAVEFRKIEVKELNTAPSSTSEGRR